MAENLAKLIIEKGPQKGGKEKLTREWLQCGATVQLSSTAAGDGSPEAPHTAAAAETRKNIGKVKAVPGNV
jgi:hypothetical protein